MNIHEILDKWFNNLRRYANVLNVNVGEEITNGKKTGRQAIVVYVKKKVPRQQLAWNELLPDAIEGVPVDVIEWTADYELGDTEPSRYNLKVQKRIASGVKK